MIPLCRRDFIKVELEERWANLEKLNKKKNVLTESIDRQISKQLAKVKILSMELKEMDGGD